jgi:hypothetical protein
VDGTYLTLEQAAYGTVVGQASLFAIDIESRIVRR